MVLLDIVQYHHLNTVVLSGIRLFDRWYNDRDQQQN